MGTATLLIDILTRNILKPTRSLYDFRFRSYGTTYTGPDQVRLGWLEHYRALAQPSPGLVKTDYDNRIALDHNFLRRYCDTTDNSWISLSSHDVVKAVQSLNTGRSADADGLTAEHFRYAGQAFYDILTTILNQIGATQQVPSQEKTSHH